MNDYGARVQFRQRKRFLSSTLLSDQLWAHPACSKFIIESSSLGVKQSGSETSHSLHVVPRLRIRFNYISSPTYVSIEEHLIKHKVNILLLYAQKVPIPSFSLGPTNVVLGQSATEDSYALGKVYYGSR